MEKNRNKIVKYFVNGLYVSGLCIYSSSASAVGLLQDIYCWFDWYNNKWYQVTLQWYILHTWLS
jgi:hypothetical protein